MCLKTIETVKGKTQLFFVLLLRWWDLFSILIDPLQEKNSGKIYKDNTVCPTTWPSYRINANSSQCLFWLFSQQGSGRVSAEQTKMKIIHRWRWKSGPDSLTPCTNTLISIVVINLLDKERSKEVGCITLITVQSPRPRNKSKMQNTDHNIGLLN